MLTSETIYELLNSVSVLFADSTVHSFVISKPSFAFISHFKYSSHLLVSFELRHGVMSVFIFRSFLHVSLLHYFSVPDKYFNVHPERYFNVSMCMQLASLQNNGHCICLYFYCVMLLRISLWISKKKKIQTEDVSEHRKYSSMWRKEGLPSLIIYVLPYTPLPYTPLGVYGSTFSFGIIVTRKENGFNILFSKTP